MVQAWTHHGGFAFYDPLPASEPDLSVAARASRSCYSCRSVATAGASAASAMAITASAAAMEGTEMTVGVMAALSAGEWFYS